MFQPIECLARILRVDRAFLASEVQKLESVTGKKQVVEKLCHENHEALNRALLELGVGRDGAGIPAKEVYDALLSRIEADDIALFKTIGEPDSGSFEGCQKIVDFIQKNLEIPTGLFLRLEKAQELLEKNPPKKVLSLLNYSSVAEMLAKEDMFTVFPALRFIEGSEWLNNVFFQGYRDLKPSDLERRSVQIRVIPERLVRGSSADNHFVAKKYHNLSHLKELGVVFILPVGLKMAGETLRAFSLFLHYLNEVPYYSRLFERIAKEPASFGENFTSLLRGDVPQRKPAEHDRPRWLVVQRYLAKDDPYDWRLIFPHVNPEAIHWWRAAGQLADLSLRMKIDDFNFWRQMDAVGDFFKDESGVEVLVSMNLIDATMSMVMEKQMIKYLYHHQEALWTKIFGEFVGYENMERLIEENLLKGIIEL